MAVHDEEFLDSIAVLALGALPAAEAHELAAHVATCGTCRRAYDEFRSTANLIGYQAEAGPAELDEVSAARMKNAVMRAVRATPLAPASSRDGLGKVASVSRRPAAFWLPYAAAAAAILFALFSSANNATLRSQHERDTARIAALQTQTSELASQAAADKTRIVALQQHSSNEASVLQGEKNRIAALKARANAQASAASAEQSRIAALSARTKQQAFQLGNADSRLAALFAPGSKSFGVPNGQVIKSGGHLYFALHDLPAPPPGKVYQAWTVRALHGLRPSITFVPRAGGMTIVELPESSAHVVAVALSVEPEGGSSKPTSKPNFLRPLL